MSIANILTNERKLDVKEAPLDFQVNRDLYVGNDIINQKLLDRIQAIETDIASIKSTLASMIGSPPTDLSEIKQSLADVLELLNPQS